jgi:hypothetical protein
MFRIKGREKWSEATEETSNEAAVSGEYYFCTHRLC